MKQILITVLLSISIVLIAGYLYIQTTPQTELISAIKSFKNSSVPVEEQHYESEQKEKQINVIDVKTGYYAGNIWYPSVIVKFKNISSEDLKRYIKSKVVFIDSDTNEQIGVHTKYLCTSNEVFIADTSMRKQYKSDVGYRGSYSSLNIVAKLYLEEQYIGQYKVKNSQI